MKLIPYNFPLVREATIKLAPVGRCIYCSATGENIVLTDEHILPDGLGGDLVLPRSSCKDCAAKTSRSELHLQREVLRYVRGVASVRSRKRKSDPPEAAVKLDSPDLTDEQKRTVNDSAPFMLLFPVTDALPTSLGGPLRLPDAALRIAVFGDTDWIEKGRKRIGGNGSFRFGNRLHAGIMGQALAKIAHAYACAALGPDAFTPFLTDYIRSNEPPLDLGNIGIFPSEGSHDGLHYLDLQIADAPVQSVLGVGRQKLLVAYIRLFATRPSPGILVVVGKPNAAAIEGLKTMNLGEFSI